MALDFQTAEIKLQEAIEAAAKAQADVDYWQTVKKILSDPRAAEVLSFPSEAPKNRAYGELKSRVFATLPPFDAAAATTKDLVDMMDIVGYVFTSANPIVSVNEALRALESEGKAVVTGRNGVSKLWKKSESSSTDLVNDLATMAKVEDKQEDRDNFNF
jgi:hypothetical protein